MAEPQHYCLKWNNYLRQLTCALDNHRAHDEFVDVTLLCEGRKITAHKVVLSSCSSYFKDIFSEIPHPHPLLIFNLIKYEDLNSIIQFMYQGEVNVKQEGLDSFLQLAKVLSVHGLNTAGTDSDSIPSSIVTSITEPVRVHGSTSTDTNRQQKIQTLLKAAHENQAHRNLSISVDRTTTHPTPSCSQSPYKKRKLTDTDNDNAVSGADDRDEQAAVNAHDIASRGCMITNLPEYILGQNNDQPSAIDGLQQLNQNLDYNGQNVANIKTEYEVLALSDIEEKYTPTDDAELTIETRRLTNQSTPHVQAKLDFTASCSNAAATGTEDALSGHKLPQCKSNDIAKSVHEMKGQIKILLEAVVEQKVTLKQLLRHHNDTLQLQKHFPLESDEELIEMDKEITPENKQAYIKTMRSILYPAGVSKNLKHLLSTKLIMDYNIEGVQGKKSLKDLSNFYGALIASITTSEKYPGTADEQLRKAIQLQKKREFKAICIEKRRSKVDLSSKAGDE